jgi:hypothetical protein
MNWPETLAIGWAERDEDTIYNNGIFTCLSFYVSVSKISQPTCYIKKLFLAERLAFFYLFSSVEW